MLLNYDCCQAASCLVSNGECTIHIFYTVLRSTVYVFFDFVFTELLQVRRDSSPSPDTNLVLLDLGWTRATVPPGFELCELPDLR